jgi:hypothetical protein
MKRPKRADINVERAEELAKISPELAKEVLLGPVSNAAARRKTRKRSQPKPQQTSIVDRVEEEIGQRVPPERFRNLIEEPVRVLDWTKDLPGYEDARLSAENAMRRIYAATDAAQVGFESEAPTFDVFFHKVRVGLIRANSLEILRWLQYAQRIGETESYLFIERLADELKNAKKRVPGAPQFNWFRALLARCWMRNGFWLMSDDLIARRVTTIRLKPDGCNRQTITKAVKELGLVKHQDTARAPIVKGFGKDGALIFREGYPPKT